MLCSYGCGQEATHQFKNGKWCCSKSWNSCPFNKEKYLKSIKETMSKLDYRKRRSEIAKEINSRLEVIEKKSKAQKEAWENPTVRERILEGMNKSEVKEKQSKVKKEAWSNKTDEEKAQHLCKVFKSNEIKPNKTELIVNDLIQNIKPNEFKYVGDGQIWISGKNPDWINVNGQKQVVEYFSNYWHKKEDEEIRKSHFKKYGFDCLVIWEDELKDKESVLQKILNF